MSNPFFINHGPISVSDILKLLNFNNEINNNDYIEDIKLVPHKKILLFFIQKNIKNMLN